MVFSLHFASFLHCIPKTLKTWFPQNSFSPTLRSGENVTSLQKS